LKSTLKKTSFYLVLGFLPLASNFLLAPLFTRFLSPVEYGLIALASLFQNYLNIVIDLGLKGSFSRYYFRYFKKPAIVKALLSTVVLAILGIAIVIYLFFFFFGDALFAVIFKNDLFTFQRFGHIVCALTLSALLNAVILTYYRNGENLKKYAWVSLGTFFMMTAGAVLGVVVYNYGALGSLIGKMTGAGIVVSFFLVAFFFRSGVRFDSRLLWPLLKYGLPLIPFGLLNITINNLDRFFIERYFDLNALGQYNIAFLISTIPFIMLNSFQSSVNPGVIKLLETTNEGNKAANHKEINNNFRVMLLFMSLMLWSMITFSGLFVRFYVGDEYRGIIQYLPILMLAFIPMIYQNIFSIFLFFHYQSRLLPLISLVTLAGAAVLNFILIPVIGIYGVAFAVLGKNLLYAFSTYWVVCNRGYYVREIFHLGKYQWLTVSLAVSCALSLLLIHLFPDFYHFATLAAGGLTGLFIFVLFKDQFLQLIGFLRSKFRF
jgi:O-antigen/teichoic acid export membrane protein